jgi:hypothetical protein
LEIRGLAVNHRSAGPDRNDGHFPAEPLERTDLGGDERLPVPERESSRDVDHTGH